MKAIYHRAHLRSPVNRSVFYSDGDEVHMSMIRNISAGGLSFKGKDLLPKDGILSFLTCVPQTPHLKNFNDSQIFEYHPALFPSVIIRAKGSIVRKFEEPSDDNNTYFGVEFSEITDYDQMLIESFAAKAASNVSYLQALLDSSKEELKIFKIAEILGYPKSSKLSVLKETVNRDLMSLKWT